MKRARNFILALFATTSLLTAPPVVEAIDWDRVTRVVDGDTVILEGLGRARLIGVDTPESVHPNQPAERFGKEATGFTRSQLEGRRVQVEIGPEAKDEHGRWLVYLSGETGESFNQLLVARGFAYAYTLFPFPLQFHFLALEDEARAKRLGLWEEARPGPYHGNDQSRVYHAPNCVHYECSRCVLIFERREAAEREGFRPHWACVGSQ